MEVSMTHALTTTALPPVASLDLYIKAVNQIPLLSAEDETRLSKQLKNENDLDAAKALVMAHLRVVVSIARRYNGYGLPFSDLIQEGNVGLMKAVKKFDYEKGVRLVSFAIHWIKAEIHEFVLKNWRIVKIATTKAQRKLFFNLRSMKSNLDTLEPSEVKRIAQDLDVKTSDVVEMETRLNGNDISLDPLAQDDDSYAPISFLSSSEADPSSIVETNQLESSQAKALSTALSTLDDRSREIIQARWLNEDAHATLHDLASRFSVSAERIRQIEAQAMKKMRDLLE